jgi:ribosomal protein L7/L12
MTEAGGLAFVCLALLLAVLANLFQLRKRVTTLTRVEAKLDLLLRNAGLQYDPYADPPAQVVEALRRGGKIEAIKHYRQATGAGLKDAKEFIEELQRRAGSGVQEAIRKPLGERP